MKETCPTCGNPVVPGDRFCGSCGTDVTAAGSGPGKVLPPLDAPPPPVTVDVGAGPVPHPPRRSKGVVIIAVGLVVVAVLALGGVVMLAGGGSEADGAASTSVPVSVASTEGGDGVAATTAAPTASPSTTAKPPATTAPLEPSVVAAAPRTTPRPAVEATPVAVGATASAVRSSSTDGCGTETFYEPENAIDGRHDTAWMAPRDGTGQSLTIVLAGPSAVRQVGLVPGYDKYDPCNSIDRFWEFRRISAVRWTFDDGATVVQQFDDAATMQAIDLGRAVVTSTVRIEILGTRPPGNERLNHTPISEVRVQ